MDLLTALPSSQEVMDQLSLIHILEEEADMEEEDL